MGRIKKIALIIAVSLFSGFVLAVFVMINFPYGSILRRIDDNIARKNGASLTFLKVHYRFPFKIMIDDLRLRRDDGTLDMRVDRLELHLRLMNFSRMKTLQVQGTGLDVKSDYVDMSKGTFTLVSRLIPSLLRRGLDPAAISEVSLRSEGVRLSRVFISGFEFTSVRVPLLEVALEKNDQGRFVVERGLIKSNLFNSEISGSFDPQQVDARISLVLTAEFFRQYANLKTMVDSFTDNGALTLVIRGSMERPTVQMIRGRQ